MSGYLQRLALSAMQPGGNIHPVLDSVFAAPKQRMGPNPLGVEESVVADTETHEAKATREKAALLPALVRTTRHSKALQSVETPAVEDPMLNNKPGQPLPPAPTGSQSVISFMRTKENERPGSQVSSASEVSEQTAPTPNQERRFPQEPSAPPSPVEKSLRPTTPFVVESFFAPETAIPPLRSPASAAARSGVAKNRPKSAAAPPRPEVPAPDEIQIHIGRVEVTATQPAIPRAPAAKPRRLAPSLDEYLRRRNRKTL